MKLDKCIVNGIIVSKGAYLSVGNPLDRSDPTFPKSKIGKDGKIKDIRTELGYVIISLEFKDGSSFEFFEDELASTLF